MNDPASTTGLTAAVAVVCADQQDEIPLEADRWARLATDVLTELVEQRQADRQDELALTFVDREAMADLNVEHMAHEGPTDVLSFPLDTTVDDDAPLRLLGDVVICPGVANDQAPAHAGTLDDELALLVVHGILHVLGHDHDDEESANRMREVERDVLVRLHWHGAAPATFRQEHDD